MAQETRNPATTGESEPPGPEHVGAALLDIRAIQTDLENALGSFRNASRMRPVDYFRFSSSAINEPGPEDQQILSAVQSLRSAQKRINNAKDGLAEWTEMTPSSQKIADIIGKVQVAFQNLLITIRKEPKTKNILAQLKALLQIVSQAGK